MDEVLDLEPVVSKSTIWRLYGAKPYRKHQGISVRLPRSSKQISMQSIRVSCFNKAACLNLGFRSCRASMTLQIVYQDQAWSYRRSAPCASHRRTRCVVHRLLLHAESASARPKALIHKTQTNPAALSQQWLRNIPETKNPSTPCTPTGPSKPNSQRSY